MCRSASKCYVPRKMSSKWKSQEVSADGPLAGRVIGQSEPQPYLSSSEEKWRRGSLQGVYSDQVSTYRVCLFHPGCTRVLIIWLLVFLLRLPHISTTRRENDLFSVRHGLLFFFPAGKR